MAQVQEVDLHVNAFTSLPAGSTAEDMVQLSLKRMRAALDKAIDQGQKEIRFIHGHGKGTLKERVYQELRVYENKGLIERVEPSFFNPAILCVIIRF